jgi:membrane-associated protein
LGSRPEPAARPEQGVVIDESITKEGIMLQAASGWIFHLDTKLAAFTAAHGAWVYLMLFAVIFVETGVVLLPFLPGDSLLFVSGTLAAGGALQLAILLTAVALAAIGGDAANFAAGIMMRKHVAAEGKEGRLINQRHLDRTREFFDRHGPQAIILARFVPVVRTFAPFVAALGSMHFGRFIAYNVCGGLLWVGLLVGTGYKLGNVSWIRDHLSMVLIGGVILSILPGVFAWAKQKFGRRKAIS